MVMRGLWRLGVALLMSCGEVPALPPCGSAADCRDDQQCVASACVERRGPSGPDAERAPDAREAGDALRQPTDASSPGVDALEDASVVDAARVDA
jgi:hypothetical protein